MKKVSIVCGATGFIGGHLCQKLSESEDMLLGIDIKAPSDRCKDLPFDDFLQLDLRKQKSIDIIKDYLIKHELRVGCIFQLASNMGGAEYIFTGENDYVILRDNLKINTNICELYECVVKDDPILFFSSSACVYNQDLQKNKEKMSSVGLKEDTVYPAYPDSDYGWEKIISERLYSSYQRANPENAHIVIGRFHNVYGVRHPVSGDLEPKRQKVIESLVRKVKHGSLVNDTIKVIGDGEQTRSFLHVSDAVSAVLKLVNVKEKNIIVNIGSTELLSINELIDKIKKTGKIENINLEYITGEDAPVGVHHRNSNNEKIKKFIGDWDPLCIDKGIEKMWNVI